MPAAIGDVHCLSVVSEMTYTVSSGTLNSSIPYHTIVCLSVHPSVRLVLDAKLRSEWHNKLKIGRR